MYLLYTLFVVIKIVSSLQSSSTQRTIVSSYNFPETQIEIANSLARDEFPTNFQFGFSLSAYQNEGAWNVSDKGLTVWDYMLHKYPSLIVDNSNGDVATDFYHKYKEDIQLAKNLGTNIIRISINWPRLLPTAFTNDVSEDGVRFYNDVINELLANGITPMITLFHAELPYTMYQLGSFLNPYIIDVVTDYARVAFTYFGDRVKLWIGINELEGMCVMQNNVPDPIGYNLSGIMEYECYRNSLLAQASIYHMYRREFAPLQKGKIGITMNSILYVGTTDSESENESAYDARYYVYGQVLEFIFGKGDITARMKDRIHYLSYKQHFPKSRLPTYTDTEKRLIKGSADFLGLNFYRADVIESEPHIGDTMSFYSDIGTSDTINIAPHELPLKPTSKIFREYVNYINILYDIPEIHITENGYVHDDDLLDIKRTVYLYEMYKTVLDLLKDGVNIRSHMIWSLADNFSWVFGYTAKVGIFSIDFNNATLPRKPKLSAKIVENVFKGRQIKPLREVYTEEADIADIQKYIQTIDL